MISKNRRNEEIQGFSDLVEVAKEAFYFAWTAEAEGERGNNWVKWGKDFGVPDDELVDDLWRLQDAFRTLAISTILKETSKSNPKRMDDGKIPDFVQAKKKVRDFEKKYDVKIDENVTVPVYQLNSDNLFLQSDYGKIVQKNGKDYKELGLQWQ